MIMNLIRNYDNLIYDKINNHSHNISNEVTIQAQEPANRLID